MIQAKNLKVIGDMLFCKVILTQELIELRLNNRRRVLNREEQMIGNSLPMTLAQDLIMDSVNLILTKQVVKDHSSKSEQVRVE